MKAMRSLWVAFATLGISITAILLHAGNIGTVHGPVDVLENAQDAQTTVKYGKPFIDGFYAHHMQQTQQKNNSVTAATYDLVDALSHDVTYVDSVQDGRSIYKVVTVSADAGDDAGHGSAVLYTFSNDYGQTWSDYVTIDPLWVAAGSAASRTTATADAVTFDLVANARIARAGNTTYVAFLSSAYQLGGANRGAPYGSVSLDRSYAQQKRKTAAQPLVFGDANDGYGSVGALNQTRLNGFMHVFITATTDDGIHWSTPRMVPIAYDRMHAWGRNGYNAAAAVPDVRRLAVASYDSALPGSLQLAALGDGTSVDRVYLAWLDGGVGDAADNGFVGAATWRSKLPTTKPIFALLTFDNAAADTGSKVAMHYMASGIAFHGGANAGNADNYTFDGQSGAGNAITTWDKIQLHAVAHPDKTFHSGGDGAGNGSVTWDKVWLVGHYNRGAAVADGLRVVAGTFDNVVAFAARGGGLGGLTPSFGSYTTLDHTGASNGTANTGNAEEFDFDSYVDGNYESATLYVVLTSNLVKEDRLMETDGTISANGETNSQASTMYVVNLLDPANAFGYQSLVSQVSFDETMEASGVVTYSNPLIVVDGNGTASNASVSDDLVVIAFEARGITRDRIAGWAHAPVASNNLTGIGYLTIDNVYVRAMLNSGASHFAGADGSSGFNEQYADRVDGYTEGTPFLSSPTQSSGGHSTTRDSVSEDAILLDLKVQRYSSNTLEQKTFIGVVFRSATNGGSKSRVTTDRAISTAANVAVRRNTDNEDLYFGNVTLSDDELKKNFDFEVTQVNSESTSADGTTRYKQMWITGDVVVQSNNRTLLNRNFVEVNICYITNAKKHNNDFTGAGYETAIGLTAQDDAFRVLSRTFELGDLLDAVRSSSSGVCLIGREEEDADIRR